jgi:predicted dehydrogenase
MEEDLLDEVRYGIIGFGNMGSHHARNFISGNVEGARFAAASDILEPRRKLAAEALGDSSAVYEDYRELLKSGKVDAVIIATPHYQHPPIAIEAFEQGLHVLIEKPAGVYTRQVRQMNEAAAAVDKVFGIMYNQRTNPVYQKVKDLIESGELGEIKRTNWIITSWYRPQSYYDSGVWRATWEGEGGGVLLNQCPHQLDLWQWMCGMPKSVWAQCEFGKYHDIEVEDDVTAFVEYPNGATGVFITSTGEAPGTNRFEVMGDRGRVVIENGQVIFNRLRIPERQFNREFTGGFGSPEQWECNVRAPGIPAEHAGILRNFTNAVLNGEKLLAPGEEGINGLQLGNAMLLSTWLEKKVDIPVDEEAFFGKLQEMIKTSPGMKNKGEGKTLNVNGTFG